MNKLFFLLLALGGFLPATGIFAQNNEIAVPLSQPGEKGHLHANVYRGTVKVVGTNRQDILVRYESLKKEEQKITEADNGLKRISGGGLGLEVSEKNNKIYVESSSHNKGIALIIEVPNKFNVSVKTHHNGDVVIENIAGEIVAQGHHGGITAKGIAGSVVANTWHGDIVVSFKSLIPDTPLAFTSYHGKIDVSLPANAKANLKMKSTKGEIFTGFDVRLNETANRTKKEKDGDTYKVYLEDWVQGSINGGGPELTAKTYSDDIYIRKL